MSGYDEWSWCMMAPKFSPCIYSCCHPVFVSLRPVRAMWLLLVTAVAYHQDFSLFIFVKFHGKGIRLVLEVMEEKLCIVLHKMHHL